MKGKNRKNTAPVLRPLARLDSTQGLDLSNSIVTEDGDSSARRKPRPPVEIVIRRESTPGTTFDIRLGRWWFGVGWTLWFDISRERGGDVVPVFPSGRGDE